MPQRPDVAPEASIEIDVDSKYIVEVIDISEGPAQWPDAKPDDVSLTWKFRMYDEAGVAVLDEINNTAYELWQFTNDKTYRSKKTGNPTKAREWTEALIGRGELSDAEIGELIDAGFKEGLLGKRGLADVEWYTTKKGSERLRIIRLRPHKTSKNGKVQSAAATETELMAAAMASTGESKSDRQARLRRELEESERE